MELGAYEKAIVSKKVSEGKSRFHTQATQVRLPLFADLHTDGVHRYLLISLSQARRFFG